MTKFEYEYDEEASAELHMDVVHDAPARTTAPVARWVEAMRRLNGVNEPLARQLLALHRDCGSGSGECDSDRNSTPMSHRRGWGCETTTLIAHHFGIEYPGQ